MFNVILCSVWKKTEKERRKLYVCVYGLETLNFAYTSRTHNQKYFKYHKKRDKIKITSCMAC